MNKDGGVEGACEGKGRVVGAVISTLLLIERSSAQDTRRAVGALRVIGKIR